MRILNIKINLKKVCSVVTALSFLFTIFNINLYANVKTGQETSDNFLLTNIDDEQNVISDLYGKITALSNNGSNTVVINIQDLHCDYSVQKNISNIIKEFSSKYPVQKIYVEGGVGKINTNWSKLIDSEYRDKVLDNLLKVGKLTGAEFYAITNDNKVPLFGVEDEKIYQDNLNRYQRILNNKKEFAKYTAKINREIDFLKAKYLKTDNKKLNKIIDQHNSGALSQDKYFAGLIKYLVDADISLSKYPNLAIYLGLSDGYKEINVKKVMAELQVINVAMKEKVSFTQYKDFLDRTGNMSDVKKLKTMLESFCRINNIDFKQKYPNLYSFLELKNRSVKFNQIELVKEEKKLINDIRVGLSKDLTDLEISYLSDFNNIFSKYLSAELTASQWDYFKTGFDKFKQLYAKYSISNDVNRIEPYFADLNKFYEINSKRDEIFVSNMGLSKNQVAGKPNDKPVQDILAGSNNIVILVSGGFHSTGVDKILNNNNVTTITVTPNLANVTADIAKQNYENILKQRKIQTQTIALKLLSNENLSEQTKQIILSMFPENMDMSQISDLAKLAETVLSQDSKIDADGEKGQITVKLEDGNVVTIDVPKEVADMIARQSITEVPKIGQEIIRVAGNNLQELLGYLKSGEGVFVPKIFEISKGLCLFAVNNKWYIGDGAIWEIEQARRSGKLVEANLDGVEPVVYEYMPGFMQKALLTKETKKYQPTQGSIGRAIIKSVTKAIQIVLLVVMLFNTTACNLTKGEDTQWQNPAIVLTDERLEMIEDEMKTLQKFDSSKIVENNKYPYLSFDYFTMTDDDKATLSTVANEDLLAGLTNLYDQSLVIMRLLQIGEIKKAEEMLVYFSNGALFKSNYENYEVTGEVVWMGIAAVQYKLLTGSNNFDDLISKVDKYLQEVADARYDRFSNMNGYTFYYTKNGAYHYSQEKNAPISTEHQLDVLVYFNLRTQYNQSDEMKVELLKTADYIYNNLYDKENNYFYRGYNDKFSVLDVHSWGLAAILSFEALNPELYKQSQLVNIDKEKIIQYVENNFSKTVTINGNTYSNLYRWSNEETSPVSFEWSTQMAVSYKLYANYLEQNGNKDKAQEYYAKAEAIIADIKAYSKDLGFEDEYPYADKSGVFNYSSYGWKVYKVEALSVDKQMDQYEWEEDGTGSFFFPISKIEGKDYTPSGLNPSIYNSDADDYMNVQRYYGSNWQTYAVTNIEFDATNIKKMTVNLRLDPLDHPAFGVKGSISDYPNASVQVQFLPLHQTKYYEDGNMHGWFEYPVYTFPANSDSLTITLDQELFDRYCNADYWKSMHPFDSSVDIRLWERSKFIVLSGKSTFLNTTINDKNVPVAIVSVEIETKDGQTIRYKTNYEPKATYEQSLLKPGESADNSAFVESESPLYLRPKWMVVSHHNISQIYKTDYVLLASLKDYKSVENMRAKLDSMGIEYHYDRLGESLKEPYYEGGPRVYVYQIYVPYNDAIRLEREGFLEEFGDVNSILPATMALLNEQIQLGQGTIFNMILTILKKETWQSIFKPASFKKDHTTQAGQKGAGIVIGATHVSMAVAFFTTIALLLTPVMSMFALPFIGAIALGAITIANTFVIGIIGNILTHVIVDVRYIKGLALEDAIKKYGKENVELTSTGIIARDKGQIINIKPEIRKGFSSTIRISWKKTIIGLMAVIIIISVIATACASSGVDNTNPSVTPPAITQVDPTLEPTTTIPEETQIVTPTVEPTQTVNPTEPTTVPTEEVNQQEQQIMEEVSLLMSHFDDGQGFVDSYYTDGMLSGEFDKLSAQEKKEIVEDTMVDQGLAVLTYIKLGRTEDAKRLLMEMNSLVVNDKLGKYMEDIGGYRGMIWWNIACQQYYLTTGDKDVLPLLMYLDYKGLAGLNTGFLEGSRITGKEADFWDTEGNIEMMASAMLKLKIMDKYGAAEVYGDGDPKFDAAKEVSDTEGRLTSLSQHLYQMLYNPKTDQFYTDYAMLDTFALGVQMLCTLERDYPEEFVMTHVDYKNLLEFVESNFATSITVNGKTYNNLYRAANKEGLPVSFDMTIQMAIAYNMAADIHEERITNPERMQNYMKDPSMAFMYADPNVVTAYRQKAQDIMDSVLAYTKDMGYTSIPATNENTLLFKYGPKGYRAPSMSTLAQYLQFYNGSFLFPASDGQTQPQSKVSQQQQVLDTFTKKNSKGVEETYVCYEIYADENDANYMNVLSDLDANNVKYIEKYVVVLDKDGKTQGTQIKLYILQSDPNLKNTDLDLTKITPKSILPGTIPFINSLIGQGKGTMSNIIWTILKKETWQSVISPKGFVESHPTALGKQGSSTVAKVVKASSAVAFLTMVGSLATVIVPMFAMPLVGIIALTGISLIAAFVVRFPASMITQTIIDVRHIKSLGLENAIKKYGKENVMLTDDGVVIKDNPLFEVKGKPVKPVIKTGIFAKVRAIGSRLISLILVLILAISMVACNNSAVAEPEPTPTTPITQPADPTETPSENPVENPVDQQEQQIMEEVSLLMSHFDDGQGFVDSYYTDGMLSGEFDKLSAQEKKEIVEDTMVDQGLAVLTYMKLGRTEDAKRLLMEMNSLVVNDKLGKYMEDIGGYRGMIWWNIACQQYYLTTGDKDVLPLLMYLDYKGLAGLNTGFLEGSRITGKEADFWDTEGNIEMMASAMLKLKIMDKYGAAEVYGDGDPKFDAAKEVSDAEGRLTSLSQHLYQMLYNPKTDQFYTDYAMLDTFALGVQMLCTLERDYPEEFVMTHVDYKNLLEFVESNFATSITVNGKTYNNLYRAANKEGLPVSFDMTIQMAIAYNMAADIHEERITNPERMQNYMKDPSMAFMYADPNVVTAYRQKAQDIMDSVLAYTKDMGYTSIPATNENTLLFKYGPKGYRAPSMSTLAQYLQFYNGSFLFPASDGQTQPQSKVSQQQQVLDTFTKKNSKGVEETYVCYEIYADENDANYMNVLSDLDANNVKYIEKYVVVLDKDGKTQGTQIKLYILQSDPNLKNTDLDLTKITPKSILPGTIPFINSLIGQGKGTMSNIIWTILKKETWQSVISPKGFVESHPTALGKQGSSTVAKVVKASSAVAFLTMVGSLATVIVPMFAMPLVGIIALTGISLIAAFVVRFPASMITQTIIDVRHIKSLGLENAIKKYGKENVMLTDDGVVIKDNPLKVFNLKYLVEKKPVYVVADKPENSQEFNFQPVPVNFILDGEKIAKTWLGNRKGATVVYVEWLRYDDLIKQRYGEIIKMLQESRYFQDKYGVNAKSIEIDFDKPNRQLEYSESGNIIIGVNGISTANGNIDSQMVISLLHNAVVDSVTVNRNSAIQIDVLDGLSTYADLEKFISEAKTADTKIIFSEKEFERVLELIREELAKNSNSKNLEDLVAERFLELTNDINNPKNDLIVIARYSSIGDTMPAKEAVYNRYGITSFIFDTQFGSKYYDKISGFTSDIKEISDLNDLSSDGSLYVFKLSSVVKNINETSSIFTFLKSVNIRKILKEKNKNFVTQAGKNFAFDQFPKLSANDKNNIIEVLRVADDNIDYTDVLRVFFKNNSAVMVYFNSLKNAQLRYAFARSVMERMLLVDYLVNNGITRGFTNKSHEDLLTAMLVKKYLNGIGDTDNTNIELSIITTEEMIAGVKAEDLTIIERQQRLDKAVMQMMPLADDMYALKFTKQYLSVSKETQAQAVNGIIKLLTVYADNDIHDRIAVETAKIMDMANFKAVLMAA